MTDIREICVKCHREFSPLSSATGKEASTCSHCLAGLPRRDNTTTNQAIPFKWEQIDAEHQRAKVFGGWLVKAYENVEHFNLAEHRHNESGWDWRIAMTFVPDAKHQWQVESL